MTKRVLVTGATGFLGGYVVDEFSRHGYQVVATGRDAQKLRNLERPRLKTWRGDLVELTKLTEPVDIVVHVAARSTIWGSWRNFYRDNVLGTQHVIDFCRRNGVRRLVFISSPSIYSGRGDRTDIKEDQFDKNNRLNNYIRSKIEAEQYVNQAWNENLETVILRPRGIIGVGDTSITPRLLQANNTLGIPLFRGGKNLVDLTCVENVALASRLAAKSSKAAGKTYNITNDEPKELQTILDELFTAINIKPRYKQRNVMPFYGLASVLETVYKILRIAKEPPLTRYTVCTLGYSQTLDISKAKQDLGYKPVVTLSKGIEHYVKAYRQTNR